MKLHIRSVSEKMSFGKFSIFTALAAAFSLSIVAPANSQSCCTYSYPQGSFYPQGLDDGNGFDTPDDECAYLEAIGLANPGTSFAVGYLDLNYSKNGRRVTGSVSKDPILKALGKEWKADGSPENLTISGPGAHAAFIWSEKSPGNTVAAINFYSTGAYLTDVVVDEALGVGKRADHITFCQTTVNPLNVPRQSATPDSDHCCGKPFPKIPGEICEKRLNTVFFDDRCLPR